MSKELTKIRIKVLNEYGSIYRFAKDNNIENTLAYYYCNTNPENMRIDTLKKVALILDCDFMEFF